MKQKVYQHIASKAQARLNCIKSNNTEWQHNHEGDLTMIESDHLPHGSGFDVGVCIDLDKTTDNKIVLVSSYHCMNDTGMYDGWIDFTVIVTPSFGDINMKICKISDHYRYNRYGLGYYIWDTLYHALVQEVDL